VEVRDAQGPADPNAPPSRRPGWGPAAQTAPPFPFTEWPYGGSTNIGTTRPSSVDSPLMVALGNTDLGKAMSDAHMQVYGWVNGGGNISTNSVMPNGNAPAAYGYTPNTVQLDEAVVYWVRLPEVVAERSHRLGLPLFRDLRRKSALHDRLRRRELSAARP